MQEHPDGTCALGVRTHPSCSADASREQEYDRHAEKLKRAETKQAEAEKEVRAFEQREKLEKEKQIVDVLVAFAEYHATFDAYNLAKQEKTTVKNEILELEERYRPFKQSKAALARIVEVSKKEQNTVDKKVSQALKDAEQKKASLAKAVCPKPSTRTSPRDL